MIGFATVSRADRRLLPEGRLSGPMPWVVAIMTFLAVLAAGASVALGNAANGLEQQMAGKVTIQIVEPNPYVRERQTRAVMAELAELGAVSSAERIDDQRLRDLLAPWLGKEGLDADLPVPTLIDVSLTPGRRGAIDEINRLLKVIAPSIRVDAHAQWLGPFRDLLSTLRTLSLALVALMATTMSAAVVLAARSAQVTHRPTIDIMHLMGATDVQIARLFQRRAALDALFGSTLGYVCGSLVVFGIGGRIATVGAALLDQGQLGWQGWLILTTIPAAAILLSVVTARWTVLRSLARMT